MCLVGGLRSGLRVCACLHLLLYSIVLAWLAWTLLARNYITLRACLITAAAFLVIIVPDSCMHGFWTYCYTPPLPSLRFRRPHWLMGLGLSIGFCSALSLYTLIIAHRTHAYTSQATSLVSSLSPAHDPAISIYPTCCILVLNELGHGPGLSSFSLSRIYLALGSRVSMHTCLYRER